MHSRIGLSTIALLAALGVAAPAQAQLLNLGNSGDGVSVNVGGSGGATVTLGGDNAVDVDLGGSTDTGGAGVDPGGASSGNIVDIDGDGDDDDALIDLDFGGDDDEGPISLGGGGDGIIDLDGITGDDILLDLFGDGSGGGADAEGDAVVTVDLGDDDGNLLDLGDADGDLLAIDELLGGGVTGDDVLLDLFGPGDVTADLSGEDTDPNDVTLDVDDDTTAVVDLFGTGDELLDTGLGGDGAAEVTGGAGDTAAAIDILGDGSEILDDLGADGDDEVSAANGDVAAAVDILGLGDADETGGGGDDDDDGNGGGDDDTGGGNDDGGDNGNGNGNGGGDTGDGGDDLGINPGFITGEDGIAPRPAVRVAAVGDADARCFTPNEEQIAYLLQNRNYDMSMTASWASGEVDLVPVRLCPEARARLAAAIETDAEVQWLQDWVWADARIHAELTDAGLGADNVLALDTKDGDVNVYVF